MKHCIHCGSNSPAKSMRCVYCHSDFIVFVGTVLCTVAAVIWGI